MLAAAAGTRAYACSGMSCSRPAETLDEWLATIRDLNGVTNSVSGEGKT
jgi:hypothetical protein